MTFSNAEKSEDWVHFEWFLWEYNARVGYSGIQKGTVGTVRYNVGDTMSVWNTVGFIKVQWGQLGHSRVQCGGYNDSVEYSGLQWDTVGT